MSPAPTAVARSWLPVTALAILLLLGPYLAGRFVLPRVEELNYSLYPLVQWARQLLAGEAPLWFAGAALGIPWPIPHTMSHTPLLAFFAVLPVFKALAALLAVHIAIQAFFTVRLCRLFGLAPVTMLVVLASVLLASPLEYLVASDAAAVYVSWTLLPVMLYAMLRLLEPAPLRHSLRYVLLLGGAVGYGILNGHVGVFSTHVLGLALVALFQPRALLRRWPAFLLAVLLALGLGAEKLYLLLHELPAFGRDTARLQYTYDQGFSALLWNLFLKPFVLSADPFSAAGWNRLIEDNALSRTFTFGSPLAAIALLAAALRFLRGGRALADARLERALWLTLAACFLVQFVPTAWLPVFVSASWTFRDPATLLGLLLAGAWCDRWLRSSLPAARLHVLFGVHLVLLVASAALFTYGPSWRSPVRGFPTQLYDELAAPGGSSFPLQRMLRDALECTDATPRCSEASRRVVYDGRAAYVAHNSLAPATGLHLNVLPLHGFQEVSFLTKGLSLDVLHPSQSKPYGMVSTLRFAAYAWRPDAFDWVLQSPALVDLLGIRVVVGADDPRYASNGLARVGVLPQDPARAQPPLALYRNPRAFPRAFFAAPEALARVRPHAACPPGAAFLTCMDVSELTAATDPWREPVRTVDTADGLALTFAPGPAPRTLLVSTLYRPEWRAEGGELSSFHGLMRLAIPAGASRVMLAYVPARMLAARSLTFACMALAVIGLLAAFLSSLRGAAADPRKVLGPS